jgi:hypothetical protein
LHELGQLAGVVVAGGVERDEEVRCVARQHMVEGPALGRPRPFVTRDQDAQR